MRWLPKVNGRLHVGGNAVEVATHQGHIVAGQIARLLRGERPDHLLNPDVRLGEGKPKDWVKKLDVLATRPGPAITDLEAHAPPPPAAAPAGTSAGSKPGAGSQMEKVLAAFGRHA